MSMSMGGGEDEPMMDINTTPLIDVMLVLLIMFIITIPIQTHAVKLDLPIDDPNAVAPPVDPVTLRQYLDITTTMTPTPELHLQPHPDARYEDVDEVLAITKRANVTAMGFVGNEAYANF